MSMNLNKLKPIAASILGAALVTSTVIPGALNADATVKKLKKITTGVKVTKSGKLISNKTGETVKGLVSYKGKVYKDGKKASGIINGIYYKSGKRTTGVLKGIYYKNGVKGTGTYKGVYFVKGKKANGLIKGLYYKSGKKATGIYKDIYYKAGKKGSGYFQDIRYSQGEIVNGLLHSVLFKDGKRVTGKVDEIYYYNGKKASGEYDGVYYEEGQAITDSVLQARLDAANKELSVAKKFLEEVEFQKTELDAIALKIGGTLTITTKLLQKLNDEDIAVFIAENKNKTSYTEEEKAEVKRALLIHQETVRENIQVAAKQIIEAAENLAHATTQIAQISKDEKIVTAARTALEEVKKAVETVEAIPGVTIDSSALYQIITKAEEAIKENPTKPTEPVEKPGDQKPGTEIPGTGGNTSGGGTTGGNNGSNPPSTGDNEGANKVTAIENLKVILGEDGKTISITANILNQKASKATLNFYAVEDNSDSQTLLERFKREAEIKDGKINFRIGELPPGKYLVAVTVDSVTVKSHEAVEVKNTDIWESINVLGIKAVEGNHQFIVEVDKELTLNHSNTPLTRFLDIKVKKDNDSEFSSTGFNIAAGFTVGEKEINVTLEKLRGTKGQIQIAGQTIDYDFSHLAPISIDLTEYNELVNSVKETDYTPESWTEYKSVVDGIHLTEDSDSTSVSAAISIVKEAQAKLAKTEEKELVDSAINSVEGLFSQGDYKGTELDFQNAQEQVGNLPVSNIKTELEKKLATIAYIDHLSGLKEVVKAESEVKFAIIKSDITLDNSLNIQNKGLTLRGINDSHPIITAHGNSTVTEDHAIIIYADDVSIDNLKVKNAKGYGISAYLAKNTILNNVSVENAEKGGIQVNGSTVTLTGTTTLEGNNWGGIEVTQSKDSEEPGKLIVDGEIDYNSIDTNNPKPTIWEDSTNGSEISVVAENSKIIKISAYYFSNENELNIFKQTAMLSNKLISTSIKEDKLVLSFEKEFDTSVIYDKAAFLDAYFTFTLKNSQGTDTKALIEKLKDGDAKANFEKINLAASEDSKTVVFSFENGFFDGTLEAFEQGTGAGSGDGEYRVTINTKTAPTEKYKILFEQKGTDGIYSKDEIVTAKFVEGTNASPYDTAANKILLGKTAAELSDYELFGIMRVTADNLSDVNDAVKVLNIPTWNKKTTPQIIQTIVDKLVINNAIKKATPLIESLSFERTDINLLNKLAELLSQENLEITPIGSLIADADKDKNNRVSEKEFEAFFESLNYEEIINKYNRSLTQNQKEVLAILKEIYPSKGLN